MVKMIEMQIEKEEERRIAKENQKAKKRGLRSYSSASIFFASALFSALFLLSFTLILSSSTLSVALAEVQIKGAVRRFSYSPNIRLASFRRRSTLPSGFLFLPQKEKRGRCFHYRWNSQIPGFHQQQNIYAKKKINLKNRRCSLFSSRFLPVLQSSQPDQDKLKTELVKGVEEKRNIQETPKKYDLVAGINKYSHDAGICLIGIEKQEQQGRFRETKVLFYGEKERISRKKHDAGDVADLMEHALESVNTLLQINDDSNKEQEQDQGQETASENFPQSGTEKYTIEDIKCVVQNNHHFRIAPFEERIPWAVALEHYPVSYEDDFNLLPHLSVNKQKEAKKEVKKEEGKDIEEEMEKEEKTIKKMELSHHLAHAWSAICQAPFDEGLVVVMDGMGELQSEMKKHYQSFKTQEVSKQEIESKGKEEEELVSEKRNALYQTDYFHDYILLHHYKKEKEKGFKPALDFIEVSTTSEPTNSNAREGETAYYFIRHRKPIAASTSVSMNKNDKSENDNIDLDHTWDSISLIPVYKRWISTENSPSELYNHGFENMESIGAIYSRVSSHIFGDWNTCGKVMGLAPWIVNVNDNHENTNDTYNSKKTNNNSNNGRSNSSEEEEENSKNKRRFISGSLIPTEVYEREERGKENEDNGRGHCHVYRDTIHTHHDHLAEAAPINEWYENDGKKTAAYVRMASQIQKDTEDIILPFIAELKKRTHAKNLCVVGGVAQNSVLNGRIVTELGFDEVFIPPYPGDEGISMGCAAFAALNLYQNKCENQSQSQKQGESISVTEDDVGNKQNDTKQKQQQQQQAPISAYLGREYTLQEMKEAILHFSPWIEVDHHNNYLDLEVKPSKSDSESDLDSISLEPSPELLESVVESLAVQNEVVAWFQGKAEVGPRALGHRSLLANPSFAENVNRMNSIKRREKFRPFAPSVLEEEVPDWFELPHVQQKQEKEKDTKSSKQSKSNISPYMSITLQVKETKQGQVPAITHVDGSARLQSVSSLQSPLYYKLIKLFAKKTGTPMVLNTSFNILKGEPIVESPYGALRSFLASREDDYMHEKGGVDRLIVGPFSIRKKRFPKELRSLYTSNEDKDEQSKFKSKVERESENTSASSLFDLDTTLLARVPYILDEVVTKGDGSEEVQSIRILLPEGEGLLSENKGTWVDLQVNMPNMGPILFQILTALPEQGQAIQPVREIIDSLVEELELDEIVEAVNEHSKTQNNIQSQSDGNGQGREEGAKMKYIKSGHDLVIQALHILYDKSLILFL